VSDRVVTTTDSIAYSESKTITKPSTKLVTERDPNTKTWGEFFKMVGIEALTATEAQKKENIDIRTEQIEQGIKVASDKGLGEWVAKRAGREFSKVDRGEHI
jgi:hypothetical protein